jgi:hypothetical protein
MNIGTYLGSGEGNQVRQVTGTNDIGNLTD